MKIRQKDEDAYGVMHQESIKIELKKLSLNEESSRV